jgi:DNA adenine methylase
MKPFLRWAGSKTQLIPEISKFWHAGYKRYVEPFCGSACVFFSLQPRSALLSDLNGELICTLSQIQLSTDIVVECLNRMKTDERSYYQVRAIDPSMLSPNERAARFIYLNSLCFNGLYRTNQAGRFNVPYGRQTRKKPFDSIELKKAAQLLKNAAIENEDFEAIVDQTGRGDFLYLDPPYVTSARNMFIEYGKNVFSEKDLSRLSDSLIRAADRGVDFVLSYADVPEIIPLRKRWASMEVNARRNIAGFAGARRTVKEILITNVSDL